MKKRLLVYIPLSVILIIWYLLGSITAEIYDDVTRFQLEALEGYDRDIRIYQVRKAARTNHKKYVASWYDYGIPEDPEFSKHAYTAASRDFERGTCVIVYFDGKEIAVRINDYGPEEWTGRDIDLSSYAFEALAPLELGLIEVELRDLHGDCMAAPPPEELFHE